MTTGVFDSVFTQDTAADIIDSSVVPAHIVQSA